MTDLRWEMEILALDLRLGRCCCRKRLRAYAHGFYRETINKTAFTLDARHNQGVLDYGVHPNQRRGV